MECRGLLSITITAGRVSRLKNRPPTFSGELIVSHEGAQHVVDFAPFSGEKDIIQWTAIYGGSAYEMKPIKQGCRVTLTFHIYREKHLRQVSDYYLTNPPLVNTLTEDMYYPRIQVTTQLRFYR